MMAPLSRRSPGRGVMRYPLVLDSYGKPVRARNTDTRKGGPLDAWVESKSFRLQEGTIFTGN